MAVVPTLYASGTLSTTANTAHTVSAPSVPGTYIWKFDLSGMVDGDYVQAWVNEKALTGGTPQPNGEYAAWAGARGDRDKLMLAGPNSTTLTEADAIQYVIQASVTRSSFIPWAVYAF
jgi:hypothetical protein